MSLHLNPNLNMGLRMTLNVAISYKNQVAIGGRLTFQHSHPPAARTEIVMYHYGCTEGKHPAFLFFAEVMWQSVGVFMHPLLRKTV